MVTKVKYRTVRYLILVYRTLGIRYILYTYMNYQEFRSLRIRMARRDSPFVVLSEAAAYLFSSSVDGARKLDHSRNEMLMKANSANSSSDAQATALENADWLSEALAAAAFERSTALAEARAADHEVAASSCKQEKTYTGEQPSLPAELPISSLAPGTAATPGEREERTAAFGDCRMRLQSSKQAQSVYSASAATSTDERAQTLDAWLNDLDSDVEELACAGPTIPSTLPKLGSAQRIQEVINVSDTDSRLCQHGKARCADKF